MNEINKESELNLKEYLCLNYTSTILVMFALISEVYLCIRLIYKAPGTSIWSLYYLIAGIGSIIFIFLQNREFFLIFRSPVLKQLDNESYLRFRKSDSEEIDYFKIMVFIGLIALIIICSYFLWSFLGPLIPFLLFNDVDLLLVDKFFYFLSAAIIEELFFRMFLMGSIRNYGNPDMKLNRDLAIIIILSLPFMIMHYGTYTGIANMSILFLAGIMFGFLYFGTENITVTMIGHLLVNFFVVCNIYIL